MQASLVLPLLFLGAAGHTSMVMAQSRGTFAATGSMTTARAAHTATLLPNGKVLIAGGYQRVGPELVLASAELYDPSTNTFAPTGDMTAPRARHTATLLPDGRVLIAGGDPAGSAELYDPSTGTFTATTATGNVINPGTATLLGNGKVLIAGGNPTAELYDPATGTFAVTGTYAGSYASPVYVDTATLLSDGRVLITGCDCRLASAPVSELYDPSTGTFSLAGTMSGTMNWWWADVNTATLLTNGKVLIAGNAENDGFPGVAEIYDPSTATFTSFGNTIAPHEYSTATLLGDGTVLIAGGQLIGGSGSAGVDLYSPATGMFYAGPSMTTGRHAHTATLLLDGTVLIAGGFRSWPTGISSAELYTPAESAPAISVRAVHNAASGLTGAVAPGEIVAITGFGLGPALLVSSVPGSDGLFGTQLAGTTVQINGTPAPLVYTWATQVAAIVPDSVSGSTGQVTVTYQGRTSTSLAVPVAPTAPGIFTQDATGRGHAATINQKGAINTPAHWEGDVMTLFLTGAGHTTPAVAIYGGEQLPITQGPVPGVMQIKVPISRGTDCDLPVVFHVGNATTQPGVTIAVDLCI